MEQAAMAFMKAFCIIEKSVWQVCPPSLVIKGHVLPVLPTLNVSSHAIQIHDHNRT
jgi:hypothetical protein